MKTHTPTQKTASALAACMLALTSSHVEAATIVYSNEDFEGGTVGELTTSFDGTDYVYTANGGSRTGIYSHRTSAVDASNDPIGVHGGARGDANKHFTLRDPMTLATDGITEMTLNFAIHFDNTTSVFRSAVYYSANGNFTDTTTLEIFDPTAAPYNTADQWFVNQSVTFTASDVTGGFTDTAKIRWGKGPGSTGMGTRVFFDDIVISGENPTAAVPEPSSTALLGLSSLALLMRRRR